MAAGYVETRESKLIAPAQLELREPPVWYMDRLVPEDGMVVMYGPPKTGKTFLAMDWAFHLSQGIPWRGYKTSFPLRVTYYAAEGLGSLGERQKALRQKRGWTDLNDNMQWMTGSRRIIGDQMNTALAEMIYSLDEHQPHVVFIDTLMRHTPGADIASNADMGRTVAWLDMMRQAYGTTFVLIHHTRKGDNGFMGAQHIYGSTDVMVQLQETDHDTFKVHTEAREWDDHTLPFELKVTPVVPDKAGWATVEEAVSGADSAEQQKILEWLKKAGKAGEKGRNLQELIWPENPSGNNVYNVLKKLEDKSLVTKEGSIWRLFNMVE